MAEITSKARMHLTACGKGCRGSAMAPQTVGGIRCSRSIHLHQKGMILVRRVIKVRAMAGLAIGPGQLAGGDASPLTIRQAVAGLATEAGMGLASSHIGRCGRCSMAANAQWDRRHDMRMVVIVKVEGVTGLAVGTGGLALSATGQQTSRPCVAGRTAQPCMSLASGGVRGSCRRRMTARTFGVGRHDMGVSMGGEISAMTGVAGASSWGHGRNTTIRSTQGAIGIVTFRTGRMNLTAGTNRHTGRSAGRSGMARIAIG